MSSSPLDKLDQQIQKAVARIKKLESENKKLQEKATRLQKSLEAAPSDSAADEWRQERAEVRSRVEALTEHLESVLAE